MTGRLTSGRGLCPEVYVRRLTSGPIALGALAGGGLCLWGFCGTGSVWELCQWAYDWGLMCGVFCPGDFGPGGACWEASGRQ